MSSPATVQRVRFGWIRSVPGWHPEHATFRPFPVDGWLVRHAGGIVLVDTGIGTGHATIDAWYRPHRVDLPQALALAGVSVDDVDAVVLSHLHFDHCGQQAALRAPVFVQAAEYEAAAAPTYTVDEWAAVPTSRLRLVNGDVELAPGVRLLATPGHTPGHQSVVVDTDHGVVVLGAQCAFTAEELASGEPSASNVHDDTWTDASRASLARVRALEPVAVHLSHDDREVALASR